MILDMRDLLGRLGSRARSTSITTEGKVAHNRSGAEPVEKIRPEPIWIERPY
jgi:hypothetical protein